jgi:hypothetical protein
MRAHHEIVDGQNRGRYRGKTLDQEERIRRSQARNAHHAAVSEWIATTFMRHYDGAIGDWARGLLTDGNLQCPYPLAERIAERIP